MKGKFIFAALTLSLFSILPNSESLFAMPNPDPWLMLSPYNVDSYYYQYDPNEYWTLSPGGDGYESWMDEYLRGGEVLLEMVDGSPWFLPALDIYKSEDIDNDGNREQFMAGFVENSSGQGFYTEDTDFTLVFDAWSTSSTTYEDIYLSIKDVLGTGTIYYTLGLVEGGATLMTDDVLIGDISVTYTDYYVPSKFDGRAYIGISWSGYGSVTFFGFQDRDDSRQFNNPTDRATPGSHDTTITPEAGSLFILGSLAIGLFGTAGLRRRFRR